MYRYKSPVAANTAPEIRINVKISLVGTSLSRPSTTLLTKIASKNTHSKYAIHFAKKAPVTIRFEFLTPSFSAYQSLARVLPNDSFSSFFFSVFSLPAIKSSFHSRHFRALMCGPCQESGHFIIARPIPKHTFRILCHKSSHHQAI